MYKFIKVYIYNIIHIYDMPRTRAYTHTHTLFFYIILKKFNKFNKITLFAISACTIKISDTM